ncbi:MAG: ABC transporter permease, partial [Propionibacteriaceae bacterium]|nr:ABC transporter permease [Propionibacteriaceae bacterium]
MPDTVVSTQPVAAPPAVRPTSDQLADQPKRRRLVFLRNSKSLVGLTILAFFALVAIFGPMFAPYDPDEIGPQPLIGPSPNHWLGTTQLGQDIFSQLVIGTRGVMIVGFTAGIIATALAVLIGVSAGYFGGWRDESLSMMSNIFLVVPALPLIIIITSMMEHPTSWTVILVIALTGWAWGARVLRAQTLSLSRRDFVEAARANGEGSLRIIIFEIMPNLTAIIASTFINTVIAAVMSEVMLAYIGVASLSDWNWGTILYWAQSSAAFQQGAWWWFVPAGLSVALLGMSMALINFGIDEFVNPRLRNTGMNARILRKRHIRPRIGFTPTTGESKATAGRFAE